MFYDRFSDLCQKKGISPSTAAKENGLSNSIITYWKRGATPKYDTVQKLALYFGVSIDYLLGNDEIKKVMNFFEDTIVANAERSKSTSENNAKTQTFYSQLVFPNEINAFRNFIEVLGYKITSENDKYFLQDGTRKVEVPVSELSRLVRTSEITVSALIQDLMAQASTIDTPSTEEE